jgi:putative phosphoribosyl transferase
MRAALKALRQKQPARLVVAVPICSPETCHKLQDEVDEIICAVTPRPFQSVGFWYDDFSQTTDDEVRKLLKQAANREQLSAARIAKP